LLHLGIKWKIKEAMQNGYRMEQRKLGYTMQMALHIKPHQDFAVLRLTVQRLCQFTMYQNEENAGLSQMLFDLFCTVEEEK
jgi:hypothetical protein